MRWRDERRSEFTGMVAFRVKARCINAYIYRSGMTLWFECDADEARPSDITRPHALCPGIVVVRRGS